MRTIKEIQQTITDSIRVRGLSLSTSAVAEWRLWANVVATALATFEAILDEFRRETDLKVYRNTPGTIRWCVEMAKRFQNGYEYRFDPLTLQMYYDRIDPVACIVSIVSVTEALKLVNFKVAKEVEGVITPLSESELHNFKGYIYSVMPAGIKSSVISTSPDKIRYTVDVYYDTSFPSGTVREDVTVAIATLRASLDFNSMFYTQRFIDCIMDVPGVVTVDLKSIECRSTSKPDFEPMTMATELEAGYFDYDSKSAVTIKSINDLR